jgi:hypothetical protein
MPNANESTQCEGGSGTKQPWEPMRLTYIGHVAEIIRGGGGKLSLSGSDPGDARKPSGGGG